MFLLGVDSEESRSLCGDDVMGDVTSRIRESEGAAPPCMSLTKRPKDLCFPPPLDTPKTQTQDILVLSVSPEFSSSSPTGSDKYMYILESEKERGLHLLPILVCSF